MDKKLNILFISSWYPSRVLPSNGDFIQRHAEAVSLKHHVTAIHVITDENCTKKIEIVQNNINNVTTLIAYLKPHSNPFLKLYYFIKAYQKLTLLAGNIDVIHVNKFYPVGLFAYYLNKTKKIPYIISEHHHLYYYPFNKKIGFLEKLISKIIIKNAKYVCPVSTDLGNSMQKIGLKGNYKAVPNVINTNLFKPKKNSINKYFTLLHVSNMAKVKNSEGILNVAKKLPKYITDFKFIFIGGNPEITKKYKNTTVEFIDEISQNKLVDFYNQADVLVLFSNIETFSCVIYEAFSCGTPVISTNVGGIPEYFPKDYGILINPNDEDQLLRAIIKIYNSKKENASKMHQYVADNFSKQQIENQFSKLYFKALEK